MVALSRFLEICIVSKCNINQIVLSQWSTNRISKMRCRNKFSSLLFAWQENPEELLTLLIMELVSLRILYFAGIIAAEWTCESVWESVVKSESARERESFREQGTEANANAFKISMPGCIHFILIHCKYFHASITTTGECSHPVAKRCHTLPNPGCLPSQCEGNIVKIS